MIAILLIAIIGSQPEDDPAPLQNPAPYLHLSLLFFSVLFWVGYYQFLVVVWRAEDLLTRTDNPRRAISDAYVARGDLVDRSLQPINITTGESGSYSRQYIYPDLSPITGYINTIFGQSGLELNSGPLSKRLRGNPVTPNLVESTPLRNTSPRVNSSPSALTCNFNPRAMNYFADTKDQRFFLMPKPVKFWQWHRIRLSIQTP